MEGFSSSLCFRPICCESAIVFSNVIWSCCFAGARWPWHRLVAQFSTKALGRQTGWREELSILKVMIRLRFARKSTLDSASQTLPPNQCYYRTWVTCYRPARPNTIQYLQFIRHQQVSDKRLYFAFEGSRSHWLFIYYWAIWAQCASRRGHTWRPPISQRSPSPRRGLWPRKGSRCPSNNDGSHYPQCLYNYTHIQIH